MLTTNALPNTSFSQHMFENLSLIHYLIKKIYFNIKSTDQSSFAQITDAEVSSFSINRSINDTLRDGKYVADSRYRLHHPATAHVDESM